MDLPENLDAWKFETIADVVEQHEYEPGRYEFREVLYPTKGSETSKKDHTDSISKTVCSLANYDFGGYILFGVKDRSIPVLTPRNRIVGIPRSPDLRKEFADKLEQIQPEVYFDAQAIDIPADPENCIFVVRIPTSSKRPHMYDDRFLIRGEGGKARYMNVDEVRSQMLYTDGRLQKVRLLRMELAAMLDVCDLLTHPGTWAVRFDTGAYRVLLADTCDMMHPEDRLLETLHGIARDATILNYLLDREEDLRGIDPDNPVLTPHLREEVQTLWRAVPERRGQLHNKCGMALATLSVLFGPLST